MRYILTFIGCFIVLILFMVLVGSAKTYYANQQQAEAECSKLGGAMVRTSSGLACLSKVKRK